jgi:hypothetical protein
VLDVENRRMYVHRDPAAGAVEPVSKPGQQIRIADLLPN